MGGPAVCCALVRIKSASCAAGDRRQRSTPVPKCCSQCNFFAVLISCGLQKPIITSAASRTAPSSPLNSLPETVTISIPSLTFSNDSSSSSRILLKLLGIMTTIFSGLFHPSDSRTGCSASSRRSCSMSVRVAGSGSAASTDMLISNKQAAATEKKLFMAVDSPVTL